MTGARISIITTWIVLLAQILAAQNAPLEVTARVSSPEVYTGQSFLFEIDLNGSDSPGAPDLSALDADFLIQDAGGGSRSSQSISIVNGRWIRNVERGYTFRYQLAPRREGALTIPSVEVTVDGRTVRTQPILIQVIPPSEAADFKLRSDLSVTRAYVGQPILLTTTWYIGRNVDQVVFGMPLLDDERFETLDLPVDLNTQTDELIELSVNNRKVIAKRELGSLDGREFLTVSFVKVVVPKEPGRFELPGSTASFRATRTVRGTTSGFGGFFGGALSARTVYEDLAIPSNRPVLEVSALPATGRPANFSGLVGSFALDVMASSTEVRVGDPIQLVFTLSGPAYLDYARLPHLSSNRALDSNFIIPNERPQGLMRADAKVFTQAVRARTVDVTEIPSIQLNHFDPEMGQYAVARTTPIPISVTATRMLTSADLGEIGIRASEVDSAAPKLAPNYEDLSFIEDSGPGLFVGALALPPLIFGLLFALQRRRGRSQKIAVNFEAQRAMDELQSLSRAESGNVARLLRDYLGAKLGVPTPALTYVDVDGPLVAAGAPSELKRDLQELFRLCDEDQFAGSGGGAENLATGASRVCQAIDGLEALR